VIRPTRKQLALAATAIAVPLSAAGALSSTGSAQSTAGPRTLHFVATEVGSFESKGRLHEGSVVGWKDRVKSDDGTTGRDVGVCTITDLRRKEAFCHAVAVFPEGQLFFEFLNRESATRQTVSVVGGTGGYADARGSAVAKESRRKTDITVNLAD
jgi:hypothetical protein